MSSLDEAMAGHLARVRRERLQFLAQDPDRPLLSSAPRREDHVELGDRRVLAIAEWGDLNGTPVLLLHGAPGSRLFAPDPALTEARGVRLITFDRPGYGGSTPVAGRRIADGAEDVAAVAGHLGLTSVAVVGWSSGGPYALAAAALRPDLVRAAAVVAGDAPLDEVPEGLATYPAETQTLIRDLRRGDPAAEARIAERAAWYGEDPTRCFDARLARETAAAIDTPDARLHRRPDVVEALRASFVEGGRTGTAGLVADHVARVLPWGFDLAAIRVPVDLWWGDGDELVGRIHLEALARLIRGARTHVVPDSGHLVAATSWGDLLTNLLAPGGPPDPTGPAQER